MNNKEKLVKAHKIIAELKMDDLTYTHLSVLNKNTFFLSPFGIRFKDVAFTDILEFTLQGKLLPAKTTEDMYDHINFLLNKEPKKDERNFNKTGVFLHSSIYKARKNIGAVIHLHTSESIAVSVNPEGLLPASQHALHFYDNISYHNYDSLILSPKEEEDLLIKDLGQNNVMFLRNHGFITLGKTIEEALFYAYHLQQACKVQVNLCQNPILPSREVCIKARNDLLSFEENLGERDFNSFIF